MAEGLATQGQRGQLDGRHGLRTPWGSLLGETVDWSPMAEYLGVTIDRGLSMRTHVRNVVAQSRTTRYLLRAMLASHLPLRAKLDIYKMYVRTRLTYAAPAWHALVSETGRKSLRAQQSLAHRTISRAPRFVRNQVIARDLCMESLDEFIRRQIGCARADGARAQHLWGIEPSIRARRTTEACHMTSWTFKPFLTAG
ncbi:jg25753 [Pararge aegeria aegeria]|uniref:Jg25753 protein n=1 Tax=Pararge aegeria aegeria TaxID=348720 RepID=A0A8S4QLZ3_9NEOP|nr:jg25753 [Pararge aegeria aegeria]